MRRGGGGGNVLFEPNWFRELRMAYRQLYSTGIKKDYAPLQQAQSRPCLHIERAHQSAWDEIGLSFRSAPSRKTVGFSGALGSSPAAPITINVWPCKAETVHID
jgi:hypothetical protein